jgi:hypothetical protein
MAHEALLGNSVVFDPHSGQWINERFQRIAEIINDLSENLFLVWIPESERHDNDLQPYGVMHRHPQTHEEYIFMYLREDELDERVIARILESRSDNLLERLDHMETAKELLRLKEEADKREQMNDIARSMWKSRLHTYRHNGKKIAV